MEEQQERVGLVEGRQTGTEGRSVTDRRLEGWQRCQDRNIDYIHCCFQLTNCSGLIMHISNEILGLGIKLYCNELFGAQTVLACDRRKAAFF